MRAFERLGWMLSGALICSLLLFGCSVVEEGATNTPAQAARDDQRSGDHVPTNQERARQVPAAQDSFSEPVIAVYERNVASVVLIETGGGLGTGFVIDKQGHIVTNYHVIANSSGQVEVSFTDQENALGEVIGYDRDSDLAVVRVSDIDPSLLVPVELGDSSTLRVGQLAIAIGNPLGEERTVTAGIISALRAAKREGDDANFLIPGIIQTDASINPGNSGGPLFDSQGRVIGVNTFILDPSGRGANIGLGYAVPVNLVKKVVPDLIEQGVHIHPYLGVAMDTVTRLDAQANNLPDKGAIITRTEPGAPAEQAGLRAGDIIKAVNGEQIGTSEDVIAYLEFNTRPGDVATFTVIDGRGNQQDVEVRLGERRSQ